jgi:DNA-binding CsgD family transcriptional regulator
MTASVAPSERDLRTLAGMVSDYRSDLPAQGLPMSLLSDLMSQIRCDVISFEGFDSDRQVTWFVEAIPAHDGALDEVFEPVHWKHYWDCKPCSYPDRTGDLRSIIKIADFYSARQWHSTGMYCDLYRPKGREHELMLSLPVGSGRIHGSCRGPGPRRPPGPGRTLRMFLFRGPGRDFSEVDRALLTLLRPHLHEAYLDTERRHRADLTPRQWQLLDLVADGYTNTQVARRLDVSEGTVRKHLENIYNRLQVSSRTAAVTRAFPDRS